MHNATQRNERKNQTPTGSPWSVAPWRPFAPWTEPRRPCSLRRAAETAADSHSREHLEKIRASSRYTREPAPGNTLKHIVKHRGAFRAPDSRAAQIPRAAESPRASPTLSVRGPYLSALGGARAAWGRTSQGRKGSTCKSGHIRGSPEEVRNGAGLRRAPEPEESGKVRESLECSWASQRGQLR
eukprot:gene15136-biopygen4528